MKLEEKRKGVQYGNFFIQRWRSWAFVRGRPALRTRQDRWRESRSQFEPSELSQIIMKIKCSNAPLD